MRQSFAKASRRDIRRAVGPGALQMLDAHGEAIRQMRADLATVIGQAGWAAAQCKDHEGLLRRDVWGRLRWLLTGR